MFSNINPEIMKYPLHKDVHNEILPYLYREKI